MGHERSGLTSPNKSLTGFPGPPPGVQLYWVQTISQTSACLLQKRQFAQPILLFKLQTQDQNQSNRDVTFFSLFCFGQILSVSRPSWVMYVPRLNFKTCRFFAFLCRCHSFNLSLCHLPPFLLSYVAVSWPCCLSEFFLTGPLYPVFPPPPFLFFFCRGKNTYYSFPCILLPLVNIRQSCISNRLGFKKWHIPKKKKFKKGAPFPWVLCAKYT